MEVYHTQLLNLTPCSQSDHPTLDVHGSPECTCTCPYSHIPRSAHALQSTPRRTAALDSLYSIAPPCTHTSADILLNPAANLLTAALTATLQATPWRTLRRCA
jgi:hypothetical protein